MKVSFIAIPLLLLSATAVWAADITGKWTGQMQTPNGEFSLEFTFKQDGATLTGSVQGPQGEPFPITDGKVAGDKVSFTVKAHDGEFVIRHEGTVSGDTIKLSSKPVQGDFPGAEMTLTRAK